MGGTSLAWPKTSAEGAKVVDLDQPSSKVGDVCSSMVNIDLLDGRHSIDELAL